MYPLCEPQKPIRPLQRMTKIDRTLNYADMDVIGYLSPRNRTLTMGMSVSQDHRSEGTQIRKTNNWSDRLTDSIRVNNADEGHAYNTCSIQVKKDVGRSTDEDLVIAEIFEKTDKGKERKWGKGWVTDERASSNWFEGKSARPSEARLW